MAILIKDFKNRITELEKQVVELEKELQLKNLNDEERIVVTNKIKEIEGIIGRAEQKIADLRDDLIKNILNE
jgi:polyhydroxyalkanoate synthesis regulator phasin